MSRRHLLRPVGFDDLGLRHALADRMLPALVAAMAFLAALAIGGWTGAASLASGWQTGAASSLTVQVPQPDDQARADRVLTLLQQTQGITDARRLSSEQIDKLLRPWLGANSRDLDLPLPAVITVRLDDPPPNLNSLRTELAAAAPGTLLEQEEIWAKRLVRLVESLQACAALMLLIVAAVSAAVIAVATRGGLASRRDAIEIVHGLGATDSYIAGRFASRAAVLAVIGAAVGALIALPALLALTHIAAPFASVPDTSNVLALLPRASGWFSLVSPLYPGRSAGSQRRPPCAPGFVASHELSSSSGSLASPARLTLCRIASDSRPWGLRPVRRHSPARPCFASPGRWNRSPDWRSRSGQRRAASACRGSGEPNAGHRHRRRRCAARTDPAGQGPAAKRRRPRDPWSRRSLNPRQRRRNRCLGPPRTPSIRLFS